MSLNIRVKLLGDREPRTIPTKDLPYQVICLEGGGVVCELPEPKEKAKYAPPPVLHSRCWSSILWGCCVDFAVRNFVHSPKRLEEKTCETSSMDPKRLEAKNNRDVKSRQMHECS